jgi:hypothetical protein
MRSTAFPGVVDCFRESLLAGKHFLRPVFPGFNLDQPAANVSGGMRGTLESRIAAMCSACQPTVWAEVLRLNALDTELVKQTRLEVRRRYALTQPASE